MAVRVLDIERHSAREMGVQSADRFEHRCGNIICKGRFVGRQVVENGAAQASCLFPKTQFRVSAKNGVIGRTPSQIVKNGLNEFVELCGFVSDIPSGFDRCRIGCRKTKMCAADRPQRLHEVLASRKELEDFRIGSRSLRRGCRSSSQSAERHVKTEGEFLKLGAADIGRTVVSPGGQGVGLFHRKSGGSRTTYRTRVNVSVTEIGWCWKGADLRILLWL